MNETNQSYVGRSSVRGFMLWAIDTIENLPLMRPRWVALDVAVLVMLITPHIVR